MEYTLIANNTTFCILVAICVGIYYTKSVQIPATEHISILLHKEMYASLLYTVFYGTHSWILNSAIYLSLNTWIQNRLVWSKSLGPVTALSDCSAQLGIVVSFSLQHSV